MNDSAVTPDANSIVNIESLIAKARALASEDKRQILAITGPPGSGKSTVARAIETALSGQAAVLEMDGFHLDDSILRKLGRLDRKGAPDTYDVHGYINTLARLKRAEEPIVYVPKFDRDLEISRAGATEISKDISLIITEGNYLLLDQLGWQNVRSHIDESWFIQSPRDVLRERLIRRWLDQGLSLERAEQWADNVDLKNGDIVTAAAHNADFIAEVRDF